MASEISQRQISLFFDLKFGAKRRIQSVTLTTLFATDQKISEKEKLKTISTESQVAIELLAKFAFR